MNPFRTLRMAFSNLARMAQLLSEIREGIDNQQKQTGQALAEIRDGVANLTDVVNRKLAQTSEASAVDQETEGPVAPNTTARLRSKGSGAELGALPASDNLQSERSASIRRPPFGLSKKTTG